MAERKRQRAKSPAESTQQSDDESEPIDEEDKKRLIQQLVGELLTEKEQLTDGLLSLLTEQGGGSVKEGTDEGNFGFYAGVSEDDKKVLVDAAKEKLGSLSPVICNKILPLVIKQLVEEHERRVSASYRRIRLPKTPTADMAKMYRAAFNQWIDSPFVSYVAGNVIQLGALTAKESFVLHLYSFMGCYRSKPDDNYAIAVSGETSVGKSLIFENPFSANSHQFLNQEGCGRWLVGQHNLVMYHDISLSVLLRPSECETFKTLARTELSSSKVFAGSAYLPPLWILVTSNQRVHPHEVANPSKELRDRVKKETEDVSKKGKSVSSQQLLLPCWRASGAGAGASNRSPSTSAKLGRSLLLESNLKATNQSDCPNIRALQSRILEAHCYQRPVLEPWCIPRGEKFTRAHVLLGAHERVLSILEAHSRSDFYSWPLPAGALTTLSLVSRFYAKNMEDGENARTRLVDLLTRLEPDEEERQVYLDEL